jgi:hypothetical protein
VAGEGLTRFQRQWSQALEARFDRFEIPSTGTNFDMMNGHLAEDAHYRTRRGRFRKRCTRKVGKRMREDPLDINKARGRPGGS